MSKVTVQEIVEHIRLTLCGHPYGLELADRIEAHGIAPPDGWVLAPEWPTFEMCQAGGFKWESPWKGGFPAAYRAMLAAAPEAKP